ncbi:MAG: pallilysin-related adhesin [Treponema sp.]|jgi:hypothetical protein|nr:pallilysin-related adhesin [Treponema sp.]
MNRKNLFFGLISLFLFCALGILLLVFRPFSFINAGKDRERRQTRIIIPGETNGDGRDLADGMEKMAYGDSIEVKAALEEGEVMVAILTQDFDGDPAEEQILAYRNLLEIESPIYITYIDFDEADRVYKRIWNAPTAAARPGTISLYTQDLIGDRSACVLLTGMNGLGEHTLTIFRKNSQFQPDAPPYNSSGINQPFTRIAELRIDGSISIQEAERPQAYHLGIARGRSFTIAAYGHDYESNNILDQVEITYAFNSGNGLYEQSKITRIPGSQIEQRRLRELLSGEPGIFEAFINDLWYYVGPEGTLDSRQYIYFDPPSKELIFFGDEAQQIFTWQNASPTRYGLYISSQNISVTTLRRFLDIELESLDSIRIKVFEDVRLKIGVNASWDGSYRRAGTVEQKQAAGTVDSHIDALYDSSLGKMRFFPDGVYELNSGGSARRGRYAFFMINGQELLELRPEPNSVFRPERPAAEVRPENSESREIYRVEAAPPEEGVPGGPRKNLSLSRVRLGTMGIQELHEGIISLSAAEG